MTTPPTDISHEFDGDSGEPPSLAVIEAVASVVGEHPLDLEPLHSVVDPDALDGLCSRPKSEDDTVTVSFRYDGCNVVVRSDGTVTVTDRR